jgi:hypothetical protein
VWAGGASIAIAPGAWAGLAAPANAAGALRAASATPPVSSADAAATHTYLEAVYQLERAAVSNVLATRAAETSFAAQLGQECSGVLAGEPGEQFQLRLGHSETPRAKGERQRSELQAQTINQELYATFQAVRAQDERPAVEAYGAAVASLRWTNPRIAPLVEHGANALTETLAPGVANVCADMRAWAQSGYECPPREFAVIYGILSAPEDSVLARTPAGLVPLVELELAPDLHSHGPLVYGAFSEVPSELTVRRSDGSTLYSESLASRAHEETEFCAGYAEA